MTRDRSVVIQQGDPDGDAYYVAETGEYEVYVQQAGDAPVATLGDGAARLGVSTTALNT